MTTGTVNTLRLRNETDRYTVLVQDYAAKKQA